jgi:enoyl-CoA hydratase/carnithine racemase
MRAGVLSAHFDERVLDGEAVGSLTSLLDRIEREPVECLVLRFGDDTGTFPAPERRFLARWDETLARLARLPAKTIAAYAGRTGAAAIHLGLVTDLRVAAPDARLVFDGGRFPGLAAYWLPKFVGLGTARRLTLLGADLSAGEAAGMGLIDLIDDTADAAIKALSPLTPEATRLTRRLLDDSYLLELGAAHELTRAARFQVGGSAEGVGPWPRS